MVNSTKTVETVSLEPQCQHFVARKKRLCRMTVRPNRQYCGEHDPQPLTEDGKTDKRVPCPNDPKHTCYLSKLEKHLTICNARPGELPPYVIPNVNAPAAEETCLRKPLSEISKETLMLVIDKVNNLYDKYIHDNITTAPDRPIHSVVLEEFNECDRTESSLRHLRQASSLLWLVEDEGLVQDRTCYVELGAGKGQMSYYAGLAWCSGNSGVVAVERASLRHKRDNRLPARVLRLRTDLRHLALARVPAAAASAAVVGLAKHLCGVATDYALRCLTAPATEGEAPASCRGVVLATCCHHRCERAAYIANEQLQELGITGDDMNVMLGMVSWATCGDGRSRDRRQRELSDAQPQDTADGTDHNHPEQTSLADNAIIDVGVKEQALSQDVRVRVGRKAKAVLDWGRVLYLRERGFRARLCHYVPSAVSLENVCIVANKHVT